MLNNAFKMLEMLKNALNVVLKNGSITGIWTDIGGYGRIWVDLGARGCASLRRSSPDLRPQVHPPKKTSCRNLESCNLQDLDLQDL